MKSDYGTAVALIVAAKHSLYKCLHPQVGRSFGYLDASIEDVQRSTGRFRARLKVMLSPAWVGGTIVSEATTRSSATLSTPASRFPLKGTSESRLYPAETHCETGLPRQAHRGRACAA